MMKKSKPSTQNYTYEAPLIYVAIFYLSLAAWTVISVLFLGLKGCNNWSQLFMVSFILGFTWFFSLGISYRIRIEGERNIQLISFRRVVKTSPEEIGAVEGPHLPIGFIRFRMEREKVYLFCVVRDSMLQEILASLRAANPDIQFKSL